MPFRESDLADPYGTNPAIDGRGCSHAWGTPAVNADADSIGPEPGVEVEADAGLVVLQECRAEVVAEIAVIVEPG